MNGPRIDPRAVIDPTAELAEDVEIGPYAIIGPHVKIGARTVVDAHAVIRGPTLIGTDNRIYPFCVLGEAPQDKKYRGEPTQLILGNRNVIREFTTIHRGTVQDRGVTRVGDDNWIMAYVHIAHDCVIGHRTVMANNAALAGHVQLGDGVVLGGYTMIYQFCRVGAYSFSAFNCGIHRDVPPFLMAAGYRAKPRAINAEGLRRNQFSPEEIQVIRKAYKILYKMDLRLEEALSRLTELAKTWPRIQMMIDFLQGSEKERGIIR